jgi:hypothetical protein
MNPSNEDVSDKNEETKKSVKKSSRHWLLWWDIDKDELNKQVDNYKTFSIWESAKGQSALLLVFSAIITTVFIIIGYQGLDSWGFLDVVLFLVLAFFVYKGHRWAMICAMIFWTGEKVYAIATSSGTTPIVNIIWWAVYMSAFWLAFKIELERNKKNLNILYKKEVPMNNLEDNKKVAFCHNCGNQIEEDSKFCSNCGTNI